jgi:hypothetical protein
MIFEENAKTGELTFSKSFLFAIFDDLERVMKSSEVFLYGNVAFLLPFLIDLLIVYLTRRSNKFSIYIRNFLKKPIFFFYNIHNFSKVIEKSEQTLSAESFFKTLTDLSRFFS